VRALRQLRQEVLKIS